MRFVFDPAGIAPPLRNVLHRLAQVLQGYHREGSTVRLEGVGLVLEALDAEPPAPAAGRAVLYALENAGKVEIRARFPTGAPVVIGGEP